MAWRSASSSASARHPRRSNSATSSSATTARRFRSCLGADRGRADGRVRRRHRIGKVDADQSDRAAARSAAGHGVRRRDRCPRRCRSRCFASAIGFVPQEPFLFSDTLAANIAFGLDAIRQDGRAGQAGQAGRTRRTRSGGGASSRRRRSRGSTRTLRIFRRDTRRSSASAASRCQAARNSGPRWRARGRRPAHPDPRRRAVGGRHLHRRRNPVAAARGDAAADVDHRVAPHLHGRATPTRFSSSIAAASSSAARTTS